MSIVDEIAAALESRDGKVKRIVLSPKKYAELHQACLGMMRYTEAHQPIYSMAFMNAPVSMAAYTGFCRNCGAPSEPNECSFCHSESEWIEIQ